MPWRRPSFKRMAVGTKLQRPWPADQRACCTWTLVRSLAVDRWGDRSRRSALQPLSPGAPRDVEIGTGWGRLIARNLGEAIGVGPPAIMHLRRTRSVGAAVAILVQRRRQRRCRRVMTQRHPRRTRARKSYSLRSFAGPCRGGGQWTLFLRADRVPANVPLKLL